jgi:hypothetical protein
MKSYLLVYLITIFTFISCKNNKDEIVKMNLFLQENYEFNRKMLNQFKGDYYIRIQEQPESKIDLLNELDTKYIELISNIDSAISNQTTNIDKLIIEYNSFLNEIEQVVKSNKEYLVADLGPKITTKTNSNEFRLNTMKNRLAIAMVYAFEYASRPNYVADGLYKIEVDSIFSKTDENGTKLTLTSKYGQTIKNNRLIIINKIEQNGQEKKVDYKLKDNYSFADIEFDSLQKGTYRINGILRFYERNGKIDIPFEKEFTVE